MSLSIEINIDTQKIMARIKAQSQKATLALAQQVLKDSNYYVPLLSSALMKSGIIHSNASEGMATIEWNTPYAKRQYYGEKFDHSKQNNPNAKAKWFEVAKQNKLKEWEKLAQSFFE